MNNDPSPTLAGVMECLQEKKLPQPLDSNTDCPVMSLSIKDRVTINLCLQCHIGCLLNTPYSDRLFSWNQVDVLMTLLFIDLFHSSSLSSDLKPLLLLYTAIKMEYTVVQESLIISETVAETQSVYLFQLSQ